VKEGRNLRICTELLEGAEISNLGFRIFKAGKQSPPASWRVSSMYWHSPTRRLATSSEPLLQLVHPELHVPAPVRVKTTSRTYVITLLSSEHQGLRLSQFIDSKHFLRRCPFLARTVYINLSIVIP